MAKPKILLVEDNKTQAQILAGFLAKKGYEIITAETGAAALKAAAAPGIDIILLDRILPDMDGNKVCSWLKQEPATQDIPVIMLTTKGDVTDKVSGLNAGADDYLPKPFDTNELNARVTVRLKMKARQDELKKRNVELGDQLSRMKDLATIDPLTLLYNRRHFDVLLGNEFRRAKRYRHPLSCLMIDIDHFKAINDAYGHQAGDIVLKTCAQLIQKTLRDVDAVARWGGEEFIALIPNTAKEHALLAAERVRKAVSAYSFALILKTRVTVSIGIADIQNPAIDTHEKLVHEADMAMYQAKKNGRDRTELA